MAQLLEARFGVPQWDGPCDPLDSMVLTILSQSTSDTNRDMAYRGLRKRFKSWKEAAQADPKQIADAIRCGGLANQKSVVIKNFLAWANHTFGAYTIDPICDMKEQEAYDIFCKHPGIGVKTVAVTLLFACGRDVFPVDTHVNRVCGRLGVVPASSPPHKTHWLMQPHVPPGKGHSLHLNVIRLGREICKKIPRCPACPLDRICDYARTSRKLGLPVAQT